MNCFAGYSAEKALFAACALAFALRDAFVDVFARRDARAQAHTYHHHAARVPAPLVVVAARGRRGVYRARTPSANCGGHDAVARACALGAEIWRPNVVADDDSE